MVMELDTRVTLVISEITEGIDTTGTDIKDLIVRELLFLVKA
jgi:hypothetical protein